MAVSVRPDPERGSGMVVRQFPADADDTAAEHLYRRYPNTAL
jgi:hypothetical protein